MPFNPTNIVINKPWTRVDVMLIAFFRIQWRVSCQRRPTMNMRGSETTFTRSCRSGDWRSPTTRQQTWTKTGRRPTSYSRSVPAPFELEIYLHSFPSDLWPVVLWSLKISGLSSSGPFRSPVCRPLADPLRSPVCPLIPSDLWSVVL